MGRLKTVATAEVNAVPIETPRPEYRQVADALRQAIQDGEFPPGSLLPSEPELAARYGVTRATVNRALSDLRTEGLIRPQRGKGTTVNPLPVIRRATIGRQARETRERGQARGAFEAELRQAGLEPRSDASVSQVPAPEEVAGMLGIPAGTPVLARRRVMYADDIPVQLATSYLPLDLAAGTAIAEQDTGPGGTYSRLAELGHAPVRFREVTRVRPPDDAEARTLQLDPDHRVLDITRRASTADSRVVEVTLIVLPAHQWELDTEWEAQ
jgi:GntR family transcriptional regulator